MPTSRVEALERYSRQIPLIGVEGQEKLRRSTVLVAGVGGLGSPASLYLAAAGVGRLILVDNGLVEESNLQRQILYTTSDIDEPKVSAAAKRLRELNPDVEIEAIRASLTEDLLASLISRADVIVDGLDNWEARIIIDKIAYRNGKPYIHAGVEGYHGQLTVIIPGETPCLRCIFPVKPGGRRTAIPVFPTTPGVIGVLEANEALKILLDRKEGLLANKILVYDGLRGIFETIKITVKPDCPICK